MMLIRSVSLFIPSYIFCICLMLQANAQTPFLTSYTSNDYKAGVINWGGTQDKSGMLYFANIDGVLQFDGLKWQLHYLPKKETVFSIALHKSGKIYVGGARQLGFMERDSSGQLRFQSLKNLLPQKAQSKLKAVYNVFIINDIIIFQSVKALFVYQNGSFRILDISSRDIFFLGDKLLIRKNQQLFEYLPNGNLQPTTFLEGFPINTLATITPLSKHRFLLMNYQRAFTICNTQAPLNNRFRLVSTMDSVKNARIQKIKLLYDGKLAISTTNQGLFIFNQKLEFFYKIDKENGLKTNKVYDIFEDHQHNLWLPLYYGIAQASVGSPILQFANKDLSGGLITTLNKFKNTTYIGTTKGLFFKNSPQALPKLVKNTEGENWNVYVFDNKVYLAHQKGVFHIQKDVAKKLASFRFVHSLTKLKSPENTFVVGTYDTGIWLLQQKNNRWNKTKIKGFEKETRFIQEDSLGNVWIAHYNEGIYKLTLNTRKDSVLSVSFYDKKSGLPSNKNNRVYRLRNGEIITTTTQGFYRYNSAKDKFVAYDKFNAPLKNEFCIYTFAEDSTGNVYFWAGQQSLNQETLCVLKKQPDGSYKISSRVFNNIAVATQGLRIDVDAPILIDKQQVLVGHLSNLKVYNSGQPNNIDTDYQVVINTVTLKDSIIYRYGTPQKQLRLPYELRDIKFSFAAMSYENIAQNKYSYQLVGYDKEWSKWQASPTATFTSLPEGRYTFKVKSKNIYEKESKVTTFQFRIFPPWYRTWWAYTLYVILGIVLITIIAKVNSWRLRQQKEALEVIVHERTEEIRTQNEELQQNQEEILAQRGFIENQNKTLIEKNSQIQQSLKAALVIQKAILPFDSRMKKIFTEYFIIYRPKDVVSGDFYWVEQVNNQTILIVADCTGHGVPGAFMSLISYNLLDKIILLQKRYDPAEILEHLHSQVNLFLKQDRVKSHNGLDAAVVVIEKNNADTHITFAGARRPLLYWNAEKQGQIQQIKGTRKSIGGIQNSTVQFENHALTLPPHSIIYTGSDGFEDQNNKSRKKFGKYNLLNALNDGVKLPLDTQKQALENVLQKHMEDTTQRDDILWMGFKL